MDEKAVVIQQAKEKAIWKFVVSFLKIDMQTISLTADCLPPQLY
ncbi:MAG: hypothetical protein WKF90_04250 [Pyrinomonadaceae bacterium]